MLEDLISEHKSVLKRYSILLRSGLYDSALTFKNKLFSIQEKIIITLNEDDLDTHPCMRDFIHNDSSDSYSTLSSSSSSHNEFLGGSIHLTNSSLQSSPAQRTSYVLDEFSSTSSDSDDTSTESSAEDTIASIEEVNPLQIPDVNIPTLDYTKIAKSISIRNNSDIDLIVERLLDFKSHQKFGNEASQQYAILQSMPISIDKLVRLFYLHFKFIQSYPDHDTCIIYSEEEIEIFSLLKSWINANPALRQSTSSIIHTLSSYYGQVSRNPNDALSYFTALYKMIIPLDLELLCCLIQDNLSSIEKIANQSIILLLGQTGSGKSTTIHFMAGAEFEQVRIDGIKHFQSSIRDEDLFSGIKCSPFTRSETRSVSAISINCPNAVSSDIGKFIVCDSPGFGDTDGVEVDIANSIGIAKAAQAALAVRPVLCISSQSTSDRWEALDDILMTLTRFIPSIDKHFKSLTYLFTKYHSSEAMDVHYILKSKYNLLRRSRNSNSKLQKMISNMATSTVKGATVLDLKTTDRDSLLKAIFDKPEIKNTNNTFREFVTEKSLAVLNHAIDRLVNKCHVNSHTGDFLSLSHDYQLLSLLNSYIQTPEINFSFAYLKKYLSAYQKVILSNIEQNFHQMLVSSATSTSFASIFTEDKLKVFSSIRTLFDEINLEAEPFQLDWLRSTNETLLHRVIELGDLLNEYTIDKAINQLLILTHIISLFAKLCKIEDFNITMLTERLSFVQSKVNALFEQAISDCKSDIQQMKTDSIAQYDPSLSVILTFENTSYSERVRNLYDQLQDMITSSETNELSFGQLMPLHDWVLSLLIVYYDESKPCYSILKDLEARCRDSLMTYLSNQTREAENVLSSDRIDQLSQVTGYLDTLSDAKDFSYALSEKANDAYHAILSRLKSPFIHNITALTRFSEKLDDKLFFEHDTAFSTIIHDSINLLDETPSDLSYLSEVRSDLSDLVDALLKKILTQIRQLPGYRKISYISTTSPDDLFHFLKAFSQLLIIVSRSDDFSDFFNDARDKIVSILRNDLDKVNDLFKSSLTYLNPEKSIQFLLFSHVYSMGYLLVPEVPIRNYSTRLTESYQSIYEHILSQSQMLLKDCSIHVRDIPYIATLFKRNLHLLYRYHLVINDICSNLSIYNEFSDISDHLNSIDTCYHDVFHGNGLLPSYFDYMQSHIESIADGDIDPIIYRKVYMLEVLSAFDDDFKNDYRFSLLQKQLQKIIEKQHSVAISKLEDSISSEDPQAFQNQHTFILNNHHPISEESNQILLAHLISTNERSALLLSRVSKLDLSIVQSSEIHELFDEFQTIESWVRCVDSFPEPGRSSLMQSLRDVRSYLISLPSLVVDAMKQSIQSVQLVTAHAQLSLYIASITRSTNVFFSQISGADDLVRAKRALSIDLFVKATPSLSIHQFSNYCITRTEENLNDSISTIVSACAVQPLHEYKFQPPLHIYTQLSDLSEINDNYALLQTTLLAGVESTMRSAIQRFDSFAPGTFDYDFLSQILMNINTYLPHSIAGDILDSSQFHLQNHINYMSTLKREITTNIEMKNHDEILRMFDKISGTVTYKELLSGLNDFIQQDFMQYEHEIRDNGISDHLNAFITQWSKWKCIIKYLNQYSEHDWINHDESFDELIAHYGQLSQSVLSEISFKTILLSSILDDNVVQDDPSTIEHILNSLEDLIALQNFYVNRYDSNSFDQDFVLLFTAWCSDVDDQYFIIQFDLILDFFRFHHIRFKNLYHSEDFSQAESLLDAYSESFSQIEAILASEPAQESTSFSHFYSFLNAFNRCMSYQDMVQSITIKIEELKQTCHTQFLYHESTLSKFSKDREDFYQRIYKSYQALVDCLPINDHLENTDVPTIVQSANQSIALNITSYFDEILSFIPRIPSYNTKLYQDFDVLIHNVRHIESIFDSTEFESVPDSFHIDLKVRFNFRLSEFAQSYSENQELSTQLEDVVEPLIQLKLFSIYVSYYTETVNSAIDQILDSLRQNSQSADFIYTRLARMLVDISGDNQTAAQLLIEDHEVFSSVVIQRQNLKTRPYDIDYVINQMLYDSRSTAFLHQNVRDQYDKIMSRYWEQVYNGMGDFEQWKANIINDTDQVVKDQTQSRISKSVHCLSNILSYWTLSNLPSFDTTQLDDRDYLLQPHPAQIVAILRILTLDIPDAAYLKNHLARVHTGEGKSIVLAATAVLLALLGYQVDCVSYSQYLSSRDYESFKPMFDAFNVSDYISYGTFHSLCENQLNRFGDARADLESLIMKQQLPYIDQNQHDREPVLLIDEVDVFFSPDFYGQTYSSLLDIRFDEFYQLASYIWSSRNNQPALTFNDIKSTIYYKECADKLFHWRFLIQEAVVSMLEDLSKINQNEYVVIDNEIAYRTFHGYDTTINFRYSTMFAYFLEHENDQNIISEESVSLNTKLLINAGTFSFAMLPALYDCIIGVTGTLGYLNSVQLDTLQSKYYISNFTYIPSIYGQSQLSFNSNSNHDVMVHNDSTYMTSLVNEIDTKRSDPGRVKRPVIVFFENIESLKQCCDSPIFKHSVNTAHVNVLTEDLTEQEVTRLVRQATLSNKVTLATKSFGRGTDFRSFDPRINEIGGLHVIQTFISESISEEIQIKGRTARQGEVGSYSLVLNRDTFPYGYPNYLSFKDAMKTGTVYELINEVRQRNYQKFSTSTHHKALSLEEIHNESINFIKSLASRDVWSVTRFIYEKNHLLSDVPVSRTAFVIDITYSMQPLLDNLKKTFKKLMKCIKKITKKHGCVRETEFKLLGYRNYNSNAEDILLESEWMRNPVKLNKFISKIKAGKGIQNEAIEVALAKLNSEFTDVPFTQIILIGDASPNTYEEVLDRRAYYHEEDDYWASQPGFEEPTHYEPEMLKLVTSGVKVHCFYLNDDARYEFQQIAQWSGGVSSRLDINSKVATDQLTHLVAERILSDLGGDSFVQAYREMYDTKGYLAASTDNLSRSRTSSRSSFPVIDIPTEADDAGPSSLPTPISRSSAPLFPPQGHSSSEVLQDNDHSDSVNQLDSSCSHSM